MEPSLDVLAVLNLLGAAQGLFLSVMLLGVKGGNKIANRILATLVAAMALFVTGPWCVPHIMNSFSPT